MMDWPAAGEKKIPLEWLVENDGFRAAGAKKILPQEWLVKMIGLEVKKPSRKNDWSEWLLRHPERFYTDTTNITTVPASRKYPSKKHYRTWVF